jgi:hypothetical protein
MKVTLKDHQDQNFSFAGFHRRCRPFRISILNSATKELTEKLRLSLLRHRPKEDNSNNNIVYLKGYSRLRYPTSPPRRICGHDFRVCDFLTNGMQVERPPPYSSAVDIGVTLHESAGLARLTSPK